MPKEEGEEGGGRKETTTMEEECLLHLQRRLKEMAQEREKILTKAIAEKIQKEEQYSATNLNKLTVKWQAILRQTKTQELRGDIDVLRQSFERTMDHKDSIIKSLVDNINKARQQSDQSQRSHRQNVDLLLGLHKNRVASLNQVFTSDLDELRAQFNTEREQIMTKNQQDITHSQDVMLSLNEHHSQLQSEAQQNFIISCTEIKDQYKRQGKTEDIQLHQQLEQTWQVAKETTKRHLEIMDGKRVTCEMLQSSVERSSTDIHNKAKELQKLQKSVEALQSRIKSNQQTSKETMEALQMCVQEEKRKGIEQNKQLRQFQAKQQAKLTTMVVQKSQATKKLQGITEKAKKLTRLVEACRKLETRSEREQPLYRSSESSEEEREGVAHQEGTSESAQVMNEYEGLQGMWDRHSKVQLEKVCLQRYNADLIQEHQRLRALMRQNQTILRQSNSPSQWRLTTLPGIRGLRR